MALIPPVLFLLIFERYSNGLILPQIAPSLRFIPRRTMTSSSFPGKIMLPSLPEIKLKVLFEMVESINLILLFIFLHGISCSHITPLRDFIILNLYLS